MKKLWLLFLGATWAMIYPEVSVYNTGKYGRIGVATGRGILNLKEVAMPGNQELATVDITDVDTLQIASPRGARRGDDMCYVIIEGIKDGQKITFADKYRG